MTQEDPQRLIMDALGLARSALHMPPAPNGRESHLMAHTDDNVGRADLQIVVAQNSLLAIKMERIEARSRIIAWADSKGMSENDISEIVKLLPRY